VFLSDFLLHGYLHIMHWFERCVAGPNLYPIDSGGLKVGAISSRKRQVGDLPHSGIY
jgi:hypothetical protein